MEISNKRGINHQMKGKENQVLKELSITTNLPNLTLQIGKKKNERIGNNGEVSNQADSITIK